MINFRKNQSVRDVDKEGYVIDVFLFFVSLCSSRYYYIIQNQKHFILLKKLKSYKQLILMEVSIERFFCVDFSQLHEIKLMTQN